MNAPAHIDISTATNHDRYARCIEASKRIRWDIDADVIRGREFDFAMSFLPSGLSKIDQLEFLTPQQARLLSQVQGRTYANMFGLVERFINAKVLEMSRDHWLGDQVALEALVRFSEEELKHQELFRRVEGMIAAGMEPGYQFAPQPDEVAAVVLSKSTWSVMALTLLIELFTQAHYKASIEPDADIEPLFKDIMLYHWREESQHAIMDELEWQREDAKLSDHERAMAVQDTIALVAAVDAILQAQSAADTAYFSACCNGMLSATQVERVQQTLLDAYRYQYIFSGVEIPRFQQVLFGMITTVQASDIQAALSTLQ